MAQRARAPSRLAARRSPRTAQRALDVRDARGRIRAFESLTRVRSRRSARATRPRSSVTSGDRVVSFRLSRAGDSGGEKRGNGVTTNCFFYII